MKNLHVIAIMFYTHAFLSQYREYYSGVSLNHYRWTNPNTQFNTLGFETGFQLGIMSSPKLKFIRAIGKGFLSPYVSLEYNLARLKLITSNQIQVHALRLSMPTRFKIMTFTERKHSLYALVDPGVNLSFYQSNSIRSINIPKINPIDLYINAGIGSTFQFAPKHVKKPGYKYSGFSIGISKYIPIGLVRTTYFTSTGFLDQLRLNIGLRFYYMEPKKEKKSLFHRIFGK